jgi:DNA-binding transcriptional regulator PaaX
MSNMAKRQDFSKKIIKILSEKKALSVPEIVERITPENGTSYAITRSIKGLEESGLIEHLSSGQNYYARLTKDGKRKATSLKLEAQDTLINTTWDGYWRIILLDLPESRKNERESLRYLLKKAGFVCLKNSAWISPYPFEHMFAGIKKDLSLTTEMIIITTNNIDEETEKAFFELMKI